jgi:SAM-dependent methyltransferase
MSNSPFPVAYFTRPDETDDERFYAYPRKVVHIDAGAIKALSAQFAVLLPQNAVILDLMSSWRSHLPLDIHPARVVGLGMNADEMADNPQLDKFVVHNLNENPVLPFENDLFDAAVCTVSAQYLTQPVAVFAEVRRVLKTDGLFIVSFSNRCFPTKAVAVWQQMTDAQHLALVTRYFEEAGGWKRISAWQKTGGRGLFGAGDPLYLVYGYKAEGSPT